jgi:hypothetical protein
MVEVIGNLIHGYLVSDDSEIATKNIGFFYETLAQRFLDSHFLVRTRVLKTMMKLTQ